MHPAGIKFGLSQGLLQLRGSRVVVSDRFFQTLSAEARRRIKLGKRVPRADIWEFVVHHTVGNVFEPTSAKHTEVTPFFTGLDRIISESVMPLVEKAGIGERMGREFITQKPFSDELQRRIVRLELIRDKNEAWKFLFRECCDAVRIVFERYDPGNIEHVDLVALFVFHSLKKMGYFEALVHLGTARLCNGQKISLN